MKQVWKMLAAATCTVTLAFSAGACSSSDAAENSDASSSTDMTSSTSQNQTSNQTSGTSESSEDSTVPTELQPRGEEVSATSADGSVTVTGYATSLSHEDPKIVVTWKSNGDNKNCDLTLTREDPRGYLLNVDESAECSGTQEFILVRGFDEDSSDVPGVHNVAILGFDNIIQLGVDVPA